MADFMGIHNVNNVEPIFGADGVADGFKVSYTDDRSYDRNGKWIRKIVQCRKTVWVREYDFNSRKPDGLVHGFGKPTQYLHSNKNCKRKRVFKMTKNGLDAVSRIIKGV